MNLLSDRPAELEGLKVILDDLVYLYDRDACPNPERPHAFIYFLKVRNLSDRTITLTRRRWILRAPNNFCEIQDTDARLGEGITQLSLSQGAEVTIQGYYYTDKSLLVSGAYLGEDANHLPFFAPIPQFWMEIPAPDPQMEFGF